MTNELQLRLLHALARCMRSTAKILLGAGINYTQFDELAKRAFVEAASDSGRDGRLVNTSRVAVRTGLSRKEVARLKGELSSQSSLTNPYHLGRPARALQLWNTDPDFLDSMGRPIDLSFDNGDPSFQGLIKRVGGDVPVGAVRAELLNAGGIVELPNGKLRVQKRFFVPVDYGDELIVGLAFVIAPMLETLSHNLSNPNDAFIQRVTYSDHLPKEAATAFRAMTQAEASNFMQKIDEWLSAHEENRDLAEDVNKRVGLGIYYFESRGDEEFPR